MTTSCVVHILSKIKILIFPNISLHHHKYDYKGSNIYFTEADELNHWIHGNIIKYYEVRAYLLTEWFDFIFIFCTCRLILNTSKL